MHSLFLNLGTTPQRAFFGPTIQQVRAIKAREMRPVGDGDVIVDPVLPIMPPIDDWPRIPLTPVGVWETLPRDHSER